MGSLLSIMAEKSEEGELAFIHPSSGERVGFSINDNYHAFSLYGQTAIKQ